MKRVDVLTVCAFILFGLAHGHYNLKYPMPYNRIDCNKPDCHGPCPLLWLTGNSKARNSPDTPSAVWRRGEKVQIEWHRNNHEGGFYRRSLVPVKLMYSEYWHAKTAFNYGCFAQNMYKCGNSPECGSDKNAFAYRNVMHVPEVFPDGDYVFAMVWYGGLHWKRRRSQFSDYHTCAFVQIKGGPQIDAYRPTFTAGLHHRSDVARGKCATTSHFVGECGGLPCKHSPVVQTVPAHFRNDSKPNVLRFKDILPRVPQGKAHVKITFADYFSHEERKRMREEQKILDDKHRAAEKADRDLISSSPYPLPETSPPPPQLSTSPPMRPRHTRVFTGPVLPASTDVGSSSATLLYLLHGAAAWVRRTSEHLSVFGFTKDADCLGL